MRSIAIQRGRAIDSLRRVLRHLLEEAATGNSFNVPQVAANSATRTVDENLPSGAVTEQARRFIRNLLTKGILIQLNHKSLRVNPGKVSEIKRLLKSSPQTNFEILELSQQESHVQP